MVGIALSEPRNADFMARTIIGEPRNADFVVGADLESLKI